MFTPKVMVFKMSEIAVFLYFLLITAKSLSQFGKNKVRYSVIAENGMVNRLWT